MHHLPGRLAHTHCPSTCKPRQHYAPHHMVNETGVLLGYSHQEMHMAAHIHCSSTCKRSGNTKYVPHHTKHCTWLYTFIAPPLSNTPGHTMPHHTVNETGVLLGCSHHGLHMAAHTHCSSTFKHTGNTMPHHTVNETGVLLGYSHQGMLMAARTLFRWVCAALLFSGIF